MTDKKLIPFNLERALAGDPVEDTNGNKYVEIVFLKYANKVIAVTQEGRIHLFDRNGCSKPYACELVMASNTKTYWVNIYKFSDDKVFLSEEEAKNNIKKEFHYLKTISFELDE